MEIGTRVENGKAYLQFVFSAVHQTLGDEAVFIRVKDGENREVLNCLYPLCEEEPAVGILLHPHLWNGLENPYCYQAEAHFVNAVGKIVESCQKRFSLYTFEEIVGKGYFLNEKPFEMRAVYWDVETTNLQEVETRLELLVEMGANSIFFSEQQKGNYGEMLRLCMEKGFLAMPREKNSSLPACSTLFSAESCFLTDEYYYRKAMWGKTPFVHICAGSIQRQKNNSFSLKVYSNRKKVALYVDGVLFEFRLGAPEYLFEEIPIKKFPTVLTAQAGECNTAITIYESSQNFHNYVTFS